MLALKPPLPYTSEALLSLLGVLHASPTAKVTFASERVIEEGEFQGKTVVDLDDLIGALL